MSLCLCFASQEKGFQGCPSGVFWSCLLMAHEVVAMAEANRQVGADCSAISLGLWAAHQITPHLFSLPVRCTLIFPSSVIISDVKLTTVTMLQSSQLGTQLWLRCTVWGGPGVCLFQQLIPLRASVRTFIVTAWEDGRKRGLSRILVFSRQGLTV